MKELKTHREDPLSQEEFSDFLSGGDKYVPKMQQLIGSVVENTWSGLPKCEKPEVIQRLLETALSKGSHYLKQFTPDRGSQFGSYLYTCMKNEVHAMQRKRNKNLEDSCSDNMDSIPSSSVRESLPDGGLIKEESDTRIEIFLHDVIEWMETLKPLQRKALQAKWGIGLSEEEECKLEEIRNRPNHREGCEYSAFLQESYGLTPVNARQKLNEALTKFNEYCGQKYHKSKRSVYANLIGTGFLTKDTQAAQGVNLPDISEFTDEECAQIFLSIASHFCTPTQYIKPELSAESTYQLTENQEILFSEIEGRRMPFRGFYNFAELRAIRRIGLRIVNWNEFDYIIARDISDNNECIERINKKINEGIPLSDKEKAICESEISYTHIRILKSLKERLPRLLGLYTPRYPLSGMPCIYLFKDNIERHSRAKKQDPDVVSAYVYVHELMHAYYDSINRIGYNSVRELEESFAEYGMLFFLNHIQGTLPASVYNVAESAVQSKWIDGPKEYGFGIKLKEKFGLNDSQWIDRYRMISNWIEYDDDVRYFTSWLKIKVNNVDTIKRIQEKVYNILKKERVQPKEGHGYSINQNDENIGNLSLFVRNNRVSTLLTPRRIITDTNLDRLAFRVLHMADLERKHVQVVTDSTSALNYISYESDQNHIRIPVADERTRAAEPDRWMGESLFIDHKKWYLRRGWVDKMTSMEDCTISWAIAILNDEYIYSIGLVNGKKGPKIITNARYNGNDLNNDPVWNRAQFYVIKESFGQSKIYSIYGDIYINEIELLDMITN